MDLAYVSVRLRTPSGATQYWFKMQVVCDLVLRGKM